MTLTATTVAISRLPVSEDWHTVLGLGIASVKASLVILFMPAGRAALRRN